MAAWPQSKVANRAAGCNYKPAEDPVWPQTLLEWVSSNLHPFETISLRSASRGHDTEEWKYKNTPPKKHWAQSITAFWRTINTCHLLWTQHGTPGQESGVQNVLWTSWWRGSGGGGVAADRPTGKVMTSIHKVTAILDFVN